MAPPTWGSGRGVSAPVLGWRSQKWRRVMSSTPATSAEVSKMAGELATGKMVVSTMAPGRMTRSTAQGCTGTKAGASFAAGGGKVPGTGSVVTFGRMAVHTLVPTSATARLALVFTATLLANTA